MDKIKKILIKLFKAIFIRKRLLQITATTLMSVRTKRRRKKNCENEFKKGSPAILHKTDF